MFWRRWVLPNIVTSGDNGSETWVYDKIATDTVHSDSGAYWFVVVNGGEGGSGATSESQRDAHGHRQVRRAEEAHGSRISFLALLERKSWEGSQF